MRLANHLWNRFGRLGLDDIPHEARTVAGQCVLDWFGCALVGSREPLSEILRAEFGHQAGQCSIVGSDLQCAPGVAALLNGAAGHALDFDDTHSMMGGHPTVPVFPAALAQAQEQGTTGERLLVAFIVGVEVESRVGALVGPAPYKKGWHSTSTIGVHGAAAAACHLLGASNEQFAHALGLAASQSSGLKANFGTMTKPFHAGHAAERGLLSARLAMRGFTSNPEAVDGRQGYADAAASGREDVNWQRFEDQGDRFLIEDTLFKYHAACYLTHAAIESVGSLRAELAAKGIRPEEVEKAFVTVHPGLLNVCGIPEPKTGLEAKFSLVATTSLAMLGIDTTDTATFVDETLDKPEFAHMVDKVEVRTDRALGHTQARVELRANGHSLEEFHDTGIPATDLEAQGTKLAAPDRPNTWPSQTRYSVPSVTGDDYAFSAWRLSDLQGVRGINDWLRRQSEDDAAQVAAAEARTALGWLFTQEETSWASDTFAFEVEGGSVFRLPLGNTDRARVDELLRGPPCQPAGEAPE